MEKPKKKNSSFQKRRFWGCFSALFFVCFFAFCLIIFSPLLFYTDIPQTLLAPEKVPTAEALLTVSNYVHISDDVWFFLDVMENYSGDKDAICVRAWYADENKRDTVSNNSSLFINETWIIGASRIDVWFGEGGFINLSWCAMGELQPGIHLIEFHLKDSFWGEPFHIQQWAIEID